MQKQTLTRRTMLRTATGLAAATTASPALAGFSIGIGPISTDDFKALGRMFKNIDIGEDEEIAMGEGLLGPIVDSVGGSYQNSSVQSGIRRFADPLFAQSTRPNFNWEITVVDDNAANAWSLPGGKVAINKGLLRYVDNEHELAAVISHEMGHIEMSHAAKEIEKGAFWEGVSSVGQRVVQSELASKGAAGLVANAALAELQGPLVKLATSGYSKDAEREADQHVISTFSKSGHDADRGIRVYNTMLELVPKKSKGTTSLFSGHPDMKKRIKLLEEAAPASSGSGGNRQGFDALKKPFPTRNYFRRQS